jgi:hypothetical protein
MPKGNPDHAAEDAQPPLGPMSEDELRTAALFGVPSGRPRL